MIIKLTFTEDHLKLIPFFYSQEIDDDIVGIDKNIMFNLGNHLLEDMATILGLSHKAIKNTKYDAEGCAFDEETEQYLMSIFNFFKENLYYIETLIHQYVIDGGITVGTYEALGNELIWKKNS